MVLSLCSGLATYVILSGLTPIVPTNLVVVVVLLINLVLVLAMLGIIAWQVTGLWLAKRKQVAGAQLHTRIVGLFSVIAVVPAILLAVSGMLIGAALWACYIPARRAASLQPTDALRQE